MRTRTALRTAMSAAVALVGASCGHEFEPPDREARVAEAAERFADVSFDTVTWVGEDERALAGNEFYASRCRDCHGTLGRGATPYAIERGLEVPSLV